MIDMKNSSAVLTIAVVWTAAFALWYYAFPAPIELLGGDKVHPTKVRAGEAITITRNYRVVRMEPITITREMTKGDCRVGCEKITLPSSIITFRPGEYKGTREFVVPPHADPGVWTLSFSHSWYGRLGRVVSVPLPDLQIEVIP